MKIFPNTTWNCPSMNQNHTQSADIYAIKYITKPILLCHKDYPITSCKRNKKKKKPKNTKPNGIPIMAIIDIIFFDKVKCFC